MKKGLVMKFLTSNILNTALWHFSVSKLSEKIAGDILGLQLHSFNVSTWKKTRKSVDLALWIFVRILLVISLREILEVFPAHLWNTALNLCQEAKKNGISLKGCCRVCSKGVTRTFSWKITITPRYLMIFVSYYL